MAQVNPYLTFNANCEQAFNFYKSVFGGEFTHVGRFKDMPSETPLPDEVGNLIMHISLPISSETILMASDANEAFGQTATFGTNISISINTDSEEEATKLFNGLSAGGKVTMPLEKTFWGAFFGMFTDKFGIHWMVNYDYEQK
ncbi:VOC family protein [uncultured Flavobacterium sp.]|uniref:VOC family protein n=1 Tax=uncultured Flavobacterium sp. TaxID=165435 RepID=UPI0025D809D3|nr:VOC family protein [uncultured Flavobacterium sp.]